MSTTNVEKYVSIMRSIKLRTKVITAFSTGQTHALYPQSTIESIGLQFRKCFELIAFASLAANHVEYSRVYSNFAKHWEASKLIKNLKAINPDFYPKPVQEMPPTQPGIVNQLVDRNGDFLTASELVEAHGRCGALLHSKNPFDSGIDYDFYLRTFPIWHQRMINLLNNHQIRLFNDKEFFLIHMQENGTDDVRWYHFGRLNTRPT